MTFRMTLIAGAIAALVAVPAWATGAATTGGVQPATGQTSPARSPNANTSPGAPGAERSSDSAPALGRPADTAPGQMTRQRADGNSAQSRNPIYIQSAGHLKGMDVVDLNGTSVGKVDRIVLAPDRKSAHAVISSGGMLGIGGRDVLVSLDSLTEVDGKLKMRESKAQMDAMQEHERSDQYVELTGDSPIQGSIVEFSAFEPGQGAGRPSSNTPPGTSTQGATPSTPTPGGATPSTPAPRGASPSTPAPGATPSVPTPSAPR